MYQFPRAGFRRRLASWLYDSLLAIAIYMFIGLIVSSGFNLAFSMGYINPEGYTNASDYTANAVFFKIILNTLSLSCVAYFFIYFWTRSGQTLGMKAWRLKIQNREGGFIDNKTAFKRLFLSLLGLGNLAVIIDRKNLLSIQDRFTDTEVVILSLNENKGRL